MRIQFELPENRASELKNLMKVTGSRTNKDLFDNALTLFEWAVHEIQKDPDRIIASLDEHDEAYKQVEMSAFRNAASNARAAKLNKEQVPIGEAASV